MLDTWDQGAMADMTEMMAALTKKNINTQTKADSWTPLMILSGLNCPGAETAIQTALVELEANVSLTDKDGWNCLHWAAFHGSLVAATELRGYTECLKVKDKEGKTPVETARQEDNNSVADLFEAALNETKKGK